MNEVNGEKFATCFETREYDRRTFTIIALYQTLESLITSTASLAELGQAGLYQLYPELGNNEAGMEWAIRVRRILNVLVSTKRNKRGRDCRIANFKHQYCQVSRRLLYCRSYYR